MFRYGLALALLFSVNAAEARVWQWCAQKIGLQRELVPLNSEGRLSRAQAFAIIDYKVNSSKQQTRNALAHMVRHRDSYANHEAMAADMQLLFELIADYSKVNWDFIMRRGPDGSILFLGIANTFAAITKDKQIWKGLARKRDFDWSGRWRGTGENMVEVKLPESAE